MIRAMVRRALLLAAALAAALTPVTCLGQSSKTLPAKAKQAKIVKKGEISKKFVLKGVLFTAGAKAAIEAAGVSVTE